MAGTSKVSLPPAIEIACGRLKCPTSADFRSALFLWYDSWYLLFCWKCLFGKSSIWFREFKASGVCANAAWLCNKTPKDYFCCPQGNSSLACHQRQLAIACISSYVATWQCVFSRQENNFVWSGDLGVIWGADSQVSLKEFIESKLRPGVFSSSFCVLLCIMQMDTPWAMPAGKRAAGAAWSEWFESCLASWWWESASVV